MIGTPLESLRLVLGGRIVNALLRRDFTTVEEVAAATDDDLLEIPVLGWQSVNAIRDATVAMHVSAYCVDGDLLLTGNQARELRVLISTLANYANARQQHEMAQRAREFLEAVLGVPSARG